MGIKRTDFVYEVSLQASVELLSNQTIDLNFILTKTLRFYLVQPQKSENHFNILNLKLKKSEGWHLHDTHCYKDGKISVK